MLRIAVTDLSAESRRKITDRLENFISSAGEDIYLIPRINLRPVALPEIKFMAAPDVLLIGPELAQKDLQEISRIKKLLPAVSLIVWLEAGNDNLEMIERIVREGADDVLTHDISAQYFFRRLLMASRKIISRSSGKLVLVDAGKGGAGVTTIAAALAELVSAGRRRVVIMDCDFETQDCSRFLQARPFINENLRLLVDEERAVTEESVQDCLSSVWQDDVHLKCMTALADREDLADSHSRASRILLSVIEVLDSISDLVIVDMGCARGALRKILYRAADKVVFVVNDDPASLYSSADKLKRVRVQIGSGAQLCTVENSSGHVGLGNELLRKEFSLAAGLSDADWAPLPVPFCRVGQRWPGSGATFFSQCGKQAARSLQRLAVSIGAVDAISSGSRISWLSSVFSKKASDLFSMDRTDNVIMAEYQPERSNKAAALPVPSGSEHLPFTLLPEISKKRGAGSETVSNSHPIMECNLDNMVSMARPVKSSSY